MFLSLTQLKPRSGSAGYDSAWSTLLLREDKFGAEVNPMWITQLSHWDRALSLQNQKEGPDEVTTFNAFNTRMICCASPFYDKEKPYEKEKHERG